MILRSSSPTMHKTSLPLLKYNGGNFDSSSPATILTAKQIKGPPLKTSKSEGFKLDLKCETPVFGSHSYDIVDVALFMGRSFHVGWGPNGILVRTGAPIGAHDPKRILSF
ncbi:hypothetical protein U1Q18_003565 [Sarracenia purpurea var. burkii]